VTTQTRRPSAGPDSPTSAAVMEPLMTKAQVAHAMSVSIRMVERLVARGQLKAVRLGGGLRQVRFRPDDVRRCVDRATS
jgi:excisionase family DNA binding protein